MRMDKLEDGKIFSSSPRKIYNEAFLFAVQHLQDLPADKMDYLLKGFLDGAYFFQGKRTLTLKPKIQLKSIPISEKILSVVPTEQGVSGNDTFIVTAEKKTYFLKVIPAKGNSLQNIQLINELFLKNHIKTPKLLSSFQPEKESKIYLVYEYLSLPLLRNVFHPELNLKQLETVAKNLAEGLKKIHSLNEKLSVECMHKEHKQLFAKYPSAFKKNQKILEESFGITEEKLSSALHRYFQSFKDQPDVFLHDDINLENIMVDSAGQPVFLDTELAHTGKAGMDFWKAFFCCYLPVRSEYEKPFYRALFHYYFDGEIPLWFHENLKYGMLYKFAWMVWQHQNDLPRLLRFTECYKDIFSDVFGKDSISFLN